MKLQTALNNIRNSIRIGTIIIMFVGVVVATAAGFAHSYAGLYGWGVAHKLTGWKADTFPLLVDSFILVGELGLFLIALDGLKVRKSMTSWMDITIPSTVIAAGWGASLWFNIHHLDVATRDDQITFAIPPIAAMIGLMILLRTVHRYASQLESAAVAPPVRTGTELVPAPVPAAEPVPAPVYVPARKVSPVALPIMGAGTETRTVWPVPVQVLARTSDHGTVPALSPADSNGVVSGIETFTADLTPVETLDAPYGSESHAQTSKAVPVREPSGNAASPTAADSEPLIVPDGADERFAIGLKYVMDFHAVTGKLPGQRPVAAHLQMRNRQLAARILTHAKELIDSAQVTNGVSEAANPAG